MQANLDGLTSQQRHWCKNYVLYQWNLHLQCETFKNERFFMSSEKTNQTHILSIGHSVWSIIIICSSETTLD